MKIYYIILVALSFLNYNNSLESSQPAPPEELFPQGLPKPYTKLGMDSSFKILRPSIFVFLRSSSLWKSDKFNSTVEKLINTVNTNRAEEFMYDKEIIDPWTENIVIIEEDSYWVVTFHLRGNGLAFRYTEDIYVNYESARPERVYYISKSEFVLIDQPEDAITRAPAITVRQGIRLKTDYPDENVDSFVSAEKVQK